MRVRCVTDFNHLKYKAPMSFKSKVTKVIVGSASQHLKDKIDTFEETHANATYLGTGLFSRVYKFNDSDTVIKESLPTQAAKKVNDKFINESLLLSAIPFSVRNSQKLIANVETERGNQYLVSSFVRGKKPDGVETSWEKAHFNSLFKTLFQLDLNKIYHGDLNRGNCLLTDDGNVNLIDFQYADRFDFDNPVENDDKFKCPYFVSPSNAQMFEMANLPYYLLKLNKVGKKDKVKPTFKNYLMEKAQYSKQRSDFLYANDYNIEMARYEELLSKFLRYPTDDIMELQALKLQVLYAYRQVFSIVDINNFSNKNIISAIPAYLFVASSAKSLNDCVKKLYSSSANSDFKEFLSYESEYARYWQNKALEELFGTNISDDKEYGVFNWVLRNAQFNPHWKDGKVDYEDDLRSRFIDSVDKDLEKFNNVASLITGKKYNSDNQTQPFESENLKYGFYIIDNSINNFNEQPPEHDYLREELEDVINYRNKFLESYTKTTMAVDEGRLIPAITYSIKAICCASLLKESSGFAKNKKTYYQVSDYATQQEKIANSALENLPEITTGLFDIAVASIKSNDSNHLNVLSYDN